jgi:hypothetical protein
MRTRMLCQRSGKEERLATQRGKSSNSMRGFPASHGGLDYQIKIYIYIKMVKPVKPQKSQGFLEE